MKKALFVIANQGFRDEELFEPKQVLEDAEVYVDIAAEYTGECIGKLRGRKAQANVSLSEVNSSDYDAIIFVGGMGAYEQYKNHPRYLQLAKEAKLIAAICIAPTILANSGVFEGKKVTGWNDQEDAQKKYIESKGGIFTGNDIEIDGNIITANGPHAAKKFGEAILKKL